MKSEGFLVEHIFVSKEYLKNRQEYAKQNHPKKYSAITFTLDGKHTRINFSENDAQNFHILTHGSLVWKDYYSYKLKKPALNTQVHINY